jgi:hypothetical protein
MVYDARMAYRFRQQYESVLGKRHWLEAEGAFSAPDEAGSRVAILVPFMSALVQDPRDTRENFEKQTAAVTEQYEKKDRDPHHIMDATVEDFEGVLEDTSIPTVVVAGFGNLSAVATPLSKEGGSRQRYGYLDWLHLAGMATHLKLGEFVMLQCGGFLREFNPPLPSGVVSSFSNIRGAAGKGRYTTEIDDLESTVPPLTQEHELSYDQIKELFPLQRGRRVGEVVPDPAYVAVRGIYNRYLNRTMPDLPPPESIPRPDLREFLE